jgi:hypothetical protein
VCRQCSLPHLSSLSVLPLSGAPAKKARRDDGSRAAPQPFVAASRGGGGPPSQKQQQHAQSQAQQHKQRQSSHGAHKRDAAEESVRAPRSAKVAADSAPASNKDDYNLAPLDGVAIAFGEKTGVAVASSPPSNPFAVGVAAPAAATAAVSSSSNPRTTTAQGLELDSGMTSQHFFQWLIYPLSIESFYQNYFEKKPLFISRAAIADKLKASCTLVTTKRDWEGYLPGEGEEPTPAQNPSVKPAVTSKATLKTNTNALPSERVTVVEVPSQAHRIAASIQVAAAAAGAPSSLLPHYYASWFSISDIHSLLRDPEIEIKYREDVDITRYRNGKRETLNPQGRATEEQVSKFLSSEDASLRFLCPQKYSPRLWRMISLLDEMTGMQVGSNSYYTPRGTQGFAPHYDDVDIFVVQTEGAKRWRLYPPRSKNEILPSVSSPNFSQEEIGEPIMDVLLRAGDFLYAPRGTIHQCVASKEEASLHVTLSTCLKTNWATYFEGMLPRILQLAAEEHVDFRRSLPFHYERYMGVMHSDTSPRSRRGLQRAEFMDQFMKLLMDMVDQDLPFDAAADATHLDFLSGRVPPTLSPAHKALRAKQGLKAEMGSGSAAGGEEESKSSAAAVTNKKKTKISMHSCVRLVKDGVAR